jgi:type I restriction enzyme S subunit
MALRFKKDDGTDYPEWEERELGEIGEILTGKTPSTTNKSLWDGNIQFVTPTDISERKYQNETIRNIKNTSNLKVLPIGSIMFTCIASIGKMAISCRPCITNQQINSIIVDDKNNNEYIYYAISSISEFIKSTASSTSLPIINKTEFSKFKIKIPTLEEQEKIVNLLSNVDELILKTEDKLDTLKELKKSLMQHLFKKD